MASSPHHWFVQTDFGALLGPMPDDALAEMARTGALLVRDHVREGTDGEWRSAGDVPGLFDEQTPSLGLLSSTLEDLFAPGTSAPRESAGSRNANRRVSTNVEKARFAEESPELEFEIDTPLVAPHAVPKPLPASNELEFAVDVPLIAPNAVISPNKDRSIAPASIPQNQATTETDRLALPIRIPALGPDAALPVASETASSREIVPALPAKTAEFVEPAPTPQLFPNWEPPTSPAPRWRPPTPTSDPKTHYDKSAWLIGSIATAVVLVIVAGWWFWPRQRTDIYANYVAIYKELQERSAETPDKSGWTEFVTRAKSQLDSTIPWLEQRAKPGDREKSLLLYAGRDLQELLEKPQGAGSLHQKRLNAFFDQLQEIYGSK